MIIAVAAAQDEVTAFSGRVSCLSLEMIVATDRVWHVRNEKNLIHGTVYFSLSDKMGC